MQSADSNVGVFLAFKKELFIESALVLPHDGHHDSD